MAQASRDQNFVPTLLGVSNADGVTPVKVYADPTTHRLLTDSAGGGTGTVTEIDSGTGIKLTPDPITTTGSVSLIDSLAPLATLGSANQLIRVNAGATALEYFTASAGGVASVVGTANRISVDSTDPANPIVNIDAAYVGQATITTLGTIVTGTWAGTAIAANHGGTGQTTYAKGDLLASPGSNTLNKLSVGTDAFVLTADSASTNGVKWAAVPASTLVVGSTTISSGTTTRILYDNAGVLGEYTITGSGTVVAMQTSPSFITPTLGVASATSINKVIITAPATSATLTIADGKTVTHNATTTFAGTDGKTLTLSNTLTFTGTDGSSVNFGTGGTVLYGNQSITLSGAITGSGSTSITTSLGSFSSSALAGALTDETGTGVAVFNTKPTFVATVQTVVAVAALAIDGSLGSYFTKTIATGSTLTQSNFSTGQIFTIKITGAFTVTWFSGITWLTSGGTPPTQAAVTAYGFICTGSNTFDGYLAGTQ